MSSIYLKNVTWVTVYISDKMVIGVSVGVCALVIVVIGGIIFYKYRQHRDRYAQHDALLNNDDDNDYDIDPIDIST